MHFTRILLSIVFALFASTALAAKPEKDLVCHVGNELGGRVGRLSAGRLDEVLQGIYGMLRPVAG